MKRLDYGKIVMNYPTNTPSLMMKITIRLANLGQEGKMVFVCDIDRSVCEGGHWWRCVGIHRLVMDAPVGVDVAHINNEPITEKKI